MSEADPQGLFCFSQPRNVLVTKAAILIDGGFFLKRLPFARPDIRSTDPEQVAESVKQLVQGHLKQLNEVHRVPNHFRLLYRTFFYDARPYSGKAQTAVLQQPIDYAKTDPALFRMRLFEALRGRPNLAVRLGEVRRDSGRSWVLKARSQKRLLAQQIAVQDLNDEDFVPALRQKGVDMRIGLDIASITLKRQANVIVLVAGDADFVPAAKLARREGVQFILDPLWQHISHDLFEHIDGLKSGFRRPGKAA